MHGIFSEYYFDLVVAMLLFGLLGVVLEVDEYHVAIGVLVVGVIIVFGFSMIEVLCYPRSISI